ncbi:hypothetical protein OAE71_02675 [Synechococcus sp. AH-551-A21]|nr:hypothetical protein [Synechococcus sp. AH-551-A21]MDB4678046.1 hypothetical protein [Synechococcus sp. AH-551-A21]
MTAITRTLNIPERSEGIIFDFSSLGLDDELVWFYGGVNTPGQISLDKDTGHLTLNNNKGGIGGLSYRANRDNQYILYISGNVDNGLQYPGYKSVYEETLLINIENVNDFSINTVYPESATGFPNPSGYEGSPLYIRISSEKPGKIRIYTTNGTATEGEDYEAVDTIVETSNSPDGTFGNSYSAFLSVNILDDGQSIGEDIREFFTINAEPLDPQSAVRNNQFKAEIYDGKSPYPDISPAPTPSPILENIQTEDGFTYLSNANESLTGQSNIKLRMLGGNDLLEVTGGSNYANGNMGEDTIILRGGFGEYLGGKDSDTIEVFAAEEGTSVNGNLGTDFITGTVAGVIYRGGKDNDLLAVSQGDVWGDKASDTFRAVAGDGFAVIQDYTTGEDVVEIDMDGSWSNVGDGLMFTDNSGDQLMLLLGINDVEQVTRV